MFQSLAAIYEEQGCGGSYNEKLNQTEMEKKTETYYLDFGSKGNIYFGVENEKCIGTDVSKNELKSFLAMAKRLGIKTGKV